MRAGEFLKAFRSRKGISGAQMAKMIGIDYWRLKKWEAGKAKPNHEDLERLRSFFKLDFSQELEESELDAAVGKPLEERNKIDELTAESEKMRNALVEKEKRIKELESTIDIMKMAMDEMKKSRNKN